jgi:hypothetical protein
MTCYNRNGQSILFDKIIASVELGFFITCLGCALFPEHKKILLLVFNLGDEKKIKI